MKLETIEALFKALNEGNVRYLVAGGLAVVAHGHLRLTADIDLILDDLIVLKRKAGRTRDLDDIEKL